MKKALLIAILAISPLALSACDDKTPGKITVIYGNEVAEAVYKCGNDEWVIQVLIDDNKEHGNCVSAGTAAKYKVGDTYP